MFTKKKKWLHSSMALVLVLTAVLAGCSNNEKKSPADEAAGAGNNVKHEPVTIRIAEPSAGFFSDEDFQKYVTEPVKSKYPYMTLELVPYIFGETTDPSVTNLRNLVATGSVPDIVITSSRTASDLVNLNLEYDMSPLIKKFNLDLNVFENGIIDAVKVASSDGEKVTMLPYERNFSALFYNKDIFDKFAVSYPQDGMTWDEARILAQKLTREEGGVQYRGLEPNLVFRVGSQLSLGFVDPSTKKATVNNEPWKRVFTTLKNIYDIPGNSGFQLANTAISAFSKDRTLAMYVGLNDLDKLGSVKDLNWDMTTTPSFDKNKQIGVNFDAHVMAVTASSKHKDEAFQVITSMLSNEVQTKMAQNGYLPVLKDANVIKVFGENLPYLKGRHTEAIFKTTPATPPPTTIYDADAQKTINEKMQSVIKGEVDINTALQQAEEKINQIVASK